MGDKNIELGSGTLFIGSIPLCDVKGVDMEMNLDEFYDDDESIKLYIDNDLTFTASCTLNKDLFLHCVMTNNWLRLHGYPMRRKVRIKRYGKKN